MNKKNLAIFVLLLLVVSSVVTSCKESYADTQNYSSQKEESNSDSSTLNIDMMTESDTEPLEQSSCRIYSVGGELLSSSDWLCLNDSNGDGKIKTVCLYSGDDWSTQKHFYDEHYVCAE